MAIILRVNGTEHRVDVPEDMPLLWVLRDILDLTGTKFGCGQGDCGTCTILLDGTPNRSCVLPVKRAEGKEVRTIEGLAGETLHPLQQAWLDEQVSQCGACQPGMLLRAAALLEENPDPDDRAIDDALKRSLCRCGTHQRLRKAIHRAAGELKP
jgi:isoquinoline 1-oxidoreductase alpha subunit